MTHESFFSGCPRKHGCLHWSFSLTGKIKSGWTTVNQSAELHLHARARKTDEQQSSQETYASIPFLLLGSSTSVGVSDRATRTSLHLACMSVTLTWYPSPTRKSWLVVSDARRLRASAVGVLRSVRVSAVVPWTRRRLDLTRVHRS